MQPTWPEIHWGGFESIAASSYIIFSNGLLDPWHTSGVLQSLSDNLIAVVIAESAHHLDLRAPNPADPIFVTEARQEEQKLIEDWLNQYYTRNGMI